MRPKAIAALKRDYLAGLGTLIELAIIHGVPERTAARYCSQGGWALQRRDVTASVNEAVKQAGRQMADREAANCANRVSRFIKRSVDDVERFQSRVHQMMERPTLTPVEFRQLIAAWGEILSMGRRLFGLDQQMTQSHPLLVVQSLQTELKIIPSETLISGPSIETASISETS